MWTALVLIAVISIWPACHISLRLHARATRRRLKLEAEARWSELRRQIDRLHGPRNPLVWLIHRLGSAAAVEAQYACELARA